MAVTNILVSVANVTFRSGDDNMRAKNPEYFTLLEEFIDNYIETYDRSPSQREVSEGTGMSTAAVSRYLSYMRDNGMLNYDGTRHIITRKQRKRTAIPLKSLLSVQ